MGLDPLVLVALAVLTGAGLIWALLRVAPVSAQDAVMFGQPGEVPETLAPIAARYKALLDQNAPMALAAWGASFATPLNRQAVVGQAALMSELLTFCQHAATRDDMIVLADHGTTLSMEFERWLGMDLARHLEVMVLSHATSAPPVDPRLIGHARDHGWLAPSTLALARAGTPPAARAEPAVPRIEAPMAMALPTA